MWPFKSVKNLKESGMFFGFTDWHSHILPGVDDGIRTIEDSLNVLNLYEELGFKRVWLTPHVMEDYPNTITDLQQKYEELRKAWHGSVDIKLAAENMLDSLFEQRLDNRELLPLGDERRHLLVETSYYTPPMGLDNLFDRIKSNGYFPVLAHPERYRYMDQQDYIKLRKNGIFFQMNIISLIGGYGETAQKKAEWLLSKDMIDLIGSDLHNLRSFESFIGTSPRKNSYLSKVLEITQKCKLI